MDHPCDGYLQVKLLCDPLRAGESQNFETLALVCPRLPGSSRSLLIFGTNIDLMKWLSAPVVLRCDSPPLLPEEELEVPPFPTMDGEVSKAEVEETNLQQVEVVAQKEKTGEPTVSESVNQRNQGVISRFKRPTCDMLDESSKEVILTPQRLLRESDLLTTDLVKECAGSGKLPRVRRSSSELQSQLDPQPKRSSKTKTPVRIFTFSRLLPAGQELRGNLQLADKTLTSPAHLHDTPDWVYDREYRHLLAFIFAIDEINRSPDILPNITLGYHVYDSCGHVNKAIKDVLQILSGHTKEAPNYSCMERGALAGFIGDLNSDTSLQMAQLLNLYGYTQISYGATDTLLSDRKMYPNFFRTVPDDEMQYVAIAKLLERLKWNWVGILTSDDEYGEREIRQLSKHLSNHGICIGFKILASNFLSQDTLIYSRHAELILESTKSFLIICGSFSMTYYKFLFNNIPYYMEKTFILPDSWSVSLIFFYVSNCTLVFSYPHLYIKGLMEYFDSFRYSSHLNDPLVEDILITQYKCFLKNQMKNFYIPFTFRRPLRNCNLETFSHGLDSSDENTSYRVPRGRCSEECLPGFRKSVREGYHPCCYNCAPCSEGEISNHSDSELCKKCPENEWPNKAKTICIGKLIEYLSYEENILVLFFSITAIIFVTTSLLILGLFVWFRSTPIVRANNRNLSFILLLSLILSFLSVFLFLGHPVDITCMLQQVTFGIPFTISASSILAKTIMVFIAFKATRPGSSCRDWMGVKLPNTVMLFCSSIQVMNCILWLSISPPFQEYDMDSYPGKIPIQCNEGSVIGFYSMLGYMGFLAAVSFVLAFMVRTLPDSFNEAKYITFSMLVFCSVWIAMIPAYLSTRGKYMVAVEIFAILTSSAGILLCMFSPKLYILLLKPELNTRGTMLGKRML
ncbi:vomeronasal type-2 receptor 26-like [Lithobates pipiens]